jgi:CRP/FNR family cyclic AMP-dependent transcriptional regulator
MSLVDESPPSATVTVVEPALALSIDRATLDAKTENDPQFAARLYRAIAMFLSVRMRGTVQHLGYGSSRPATQEEIDMELLEKVHLAGARFDRILKQLTAA